MITRQVATKACNVVGHKDSEGTLDRILEYLTFQDTSHVIWENYNVSC